MLRCMLDQTESALRQPFSERSSEVPIRCMLLLY